MNNKYDFKTDNDHEINLIINKNKVLCIID